MNDLFSLILCLYIAGTLGYICIKIAQIEEKIQNKK